MSISLKNNSKDELRVHRASLTRDELNVKLISRSGIIEQDLWRPIDFWSSEVTLLPEEKFEFEINLLEMYSKFDSIVKEQCLFLFWGGVIPYKVNEKKSEVHTSSIVLNDEFCTSGKSIYFEEF